MEALIFRIHSIFRFIGNNEEDIRHQKSAARLSITAIALLILI